MRILPLHFRDDERTRVMPILHGVADPQMIEHRRHDAGPLLDARYKGRRVRHAEARAIDCDRPNAARDQPRENTVVLPRRHGRLVNQNQRATDAAVVVMDLAIRPVGVTALRRLPAHDAPVAMGFDSNR